MVTGASEGIGRAFAEELASAGINLVVVARRADKLLELKAALKARSSAQVTVLAVDLKEQGAMERLVQETALLDVGILVAAAGSGSSGPLLAANLATELEMVDVNCRAVLALVHTFGNRFALQRRGAIVLLGSLVGFQGVPNAANYAATKAYVQSLAEALRVELAPHHVDVISSAPGPVRSGFADRAQMKMGSTVSPATVARETLAALGKRDTVRPG